MKRIDQVIREFLLRASNTLNQCVTIYTCFLAQAKACGSVLLDTLNNILLITIF